MDPRTLVRACCSGVATRAIDSRLRVMRTQPGCALLRRMHFEVRIRRHGELWELRPGAYGRPHFFPSEAMALARARLAAQLAWSDRRVPTCVTVLAHDGEWRIDAEYGIAPRSPEPAREVEEFPRPP